MCGYDEIYLFIIRRQAIIVKRHFRVDVKLHLITLFLVVFSCYWYDHLPKKPTLFVPLPTVSSINWKTVRSYLPHPCEWHVTKMHYRNWQTHGRFFYPPKNNLFQQRYQKTKNCNSTLKKSPPLVFMSLVRTIIYKKQTK